MATWITHLRIAEAYAQKAEIPDFPYYLIGNLAPDSGKLNDDKLTYSPDGNLVHFRKRGANIWDAEDGKFIRDYLAKADPAKEKLFSFLKGYFHHLIVDSLWGFFIHHPTVARFSEEYKDPLFIWEVKKDWYAADFKFLEENPEWPVWRVFMESRYEIDALDIYPQQNIAEKQREIKDFYNAGREFDVPGIYLLPRHIDAFVDLSADILQLVEPRIPEMSVAADAPSSILEVIAEEHEQLCGGRKFIGDITFSSFPS